MSQAGMIASSGGGSSNLQFGSFSLTADQINNLNTTPVQILAAQGPGTYISLLQMFCVYKFNTTPYTIGDGSQIDIYISNSASFQLIGFNSFLFIDQSFSQIQPGQISQPVYTYSSLLNSPLMVVNNGSGNYSDGDGTLTFYFIYQVLTP